MVIVAGLLAAPAAAQEIGRLFHSIEQRNALDGFRKARSQQHKMSGAEQPAASPPSRIDGYVLRSDGISTVWMDGRAVAQAPAARGIRTPGHGLIGESEIRVRR